MTYSSEWPALTSDLLVRKVVALTSDHIGPNPKVTSKWTALKSDLLVRKAVALIYDLLVRMASTHI